MHTLWGFAWNPEYCGHIHTYRVNGYFIKKILLSKWAPYSFILVKIKLCGFFKQMNELNVFDYFIFSMGKWAETFVVTFFNIFGIKLAKFSFISIGMIQLFQFIVWELAEFVGAFLLVAKEMAVGDCGRATFVLVIMVIETGFSFVVMIWIIKNVLFL